MTTEDASSEYFRRQLGIHEELAHVTVESQPAIAYVLCVS